MHLLFDLKGSTHGRSAKPSKQGERGTVYKDNDFVSQKITFDVGPFTEALKAQLQKDVKMLEHLKIIDYSVLCGIHFLGRDSNQGPAMGLEDPVVLVGLGSKEYNGQQGVIIVDEKQGRFEVRLDSGEEVRIKRANLRKVAPGEESKQVLSEAPPPPPSEDSNTASGSDVPPPESPALPPPTLHQRAPSVEAGKTRLRAPMEKVRDPPEGSDTEGPPGPPAGSPQSEARRLPERSSSTSSYFFPNRASTKTDTDDGTKGAGEHKDESKSTSLFCQTQGGLLAVVGPQGEQAILCLGIIDTLIEFGWKKKMERNYKANIQRLEKTSFSVVEPELYAQRLLSFFSQHVVSKTK